LIVATVGVATKFFEGQRALWRWKIVTADGAIKTASAVTIRIFFGAQRVAAEILEA
jgi:hypothetical protein